MRSILYRKRKYMAVAGLAWFMCFQVAAQTAYFVDGYHGGVYGHYPRWKTRFMVEQLEQNPDWKINLEIEPETWDSVRIYDREAYVLFQDAITNPTFANRIEFVNPSFGQSYLFNISGESVIRQFSLGIARTKHHFPSLSFLTYSSEEPCFTSSLPQILTSFGFRYAVLKNPDTCWGGYTRAHGGEKVNWIGPDGTTMPTVTRYAVEGLEKGSTWQTTAWANSEEFVQTALGAGIQRPVGMCLQDAGWKHGPWLKFVKGAYRPSEYVLWRDYFMNISPSAPTESWRVSQDDMQVSLVWGSQVLQKLAQQVRTAENKVVMAEKIATLNSLFGTAAYPAANFEGAWRTLLLGQHHDCWIVPYNGRPGRTWADKTKVWTDHTVHQSDSIITAALAQHKGRDQNGQYIQVFNTTALTRHDVVSVRLPGGTGNVTLYDARGEHVVSQQVTNDGQTDLIFAATVPSVGQSTYRIQQDARRAPRIKSTVKRKGSNYIVNTDLYEIIIDSKAGGVIKSLKAKALDNKEFVDAREGGLTELRGFFYEQNKFLSSAQQPAVVTIDEQGPVRTRVTIRGKIGDHPFVQSLILGANDPLIRVELAIDWQGNPGIGKYAHQGKFQAENPEKAFYNDKYKLLALFPANLAGGKIYKDAPYDVTGSLHEDTFFNRWDSIKNNVVLSWVDQTDSNHQYGLALLTDHTTSYAFGKDHPLGLTLQYSGIGLWGRNYRITGPAQVRYALLPHAGKWDHGAVPDAAAAWKEPLLTQLASGADATWSNSWLQLPKGWELSSLQREGDHVLVRVYNAYGTSAPGELRVNTPVQRAEHVELNCDVTARLPVRVNDGLSAIELTMPRFGIRTIKLTLE